MNEPPIDSIPLSEALRKFVQPSLWKEYERALAPIPIKRQDPWRVNNRSREDSWLGGTSDWLGSNRSAKRLDRAAIQRARAAIVDDFRDQWKAGNLVLAAQKDPPFGSWLSLSTELSSNLRFCDACQNSIIGPNFAVKGIRAIQARNIDAAPKNRGPEPAEPYILPELHRRHDAGEMKDTCRAEAQALAAWYRRAHPGMRFVKPRSVEEIIRKDYRELKQRVSQLRKTKKLRNAARQSKK